MALALRSSPLHVHPTPCTPPRAPHPVHPTPCTPPRAPHPVHPTPCTPPRAPHPPAPRPASPRQAWCIGSGRGEREGEQTSAAALVTLPPPRSNASTELWACGAGGRGGGVREKSSRPSQGLALGHGSDRTGVLRRRRSQLDVPARNDAGHHACGRRRAQGRCGRRCDRCRRPGDDPGDLPEARRLVEVALPQDGRPRDAGVVLHRVEVHAPDVARLRRVVGGLRVAGPRDGGLDRVPGRLAVGALLDLTRRS